MQQAAVRPTVKGLPREAAAVLPLYAASLVVTLCGLGAVGVTAGAANWTPVWALLALLGHGVSFWMRAAGVRAGALFLPVMVVGSGLALQQLMTGSAAAGLDTPLPHMPVDLATAVVVGSLAVVRSFTLLSNASLLFSPIPAITMLALSGSSNPNAEIPVFFGLLLLGSLFLAGYESHLRRASRVGRRAAPLLFHLMVAWIIALLVAVVALAAPVVIQPVVGPLSPFAQPHLAGLRQFVNLQQNQAPVGVGPITLRDTPVYEVYAPEGGLLRTAVYTQYTGRSWTLGRFEEPTDFESTQLLEVTPPASMEGILEYKLHEFRFKGDPYATEKVPQRTVTQRLVTRSYAPAGVPALGEIAKFRYDRKRANFYSESGVVASLGIISPGRLMEVESVVKEIPPDRLRAAAAIDREKFHLPDTLSLPLNTARVQELARRVTEGATNNFDRVQLVLQHINSTCGYTLEGEATPPGVDAAEHYLFNSKRGACDLAATGAAVMCRAVGVPTRIAVGYVADEPLPGGGFLVRQAHAHMWIESFFPGYGWVPFNPAPPMSTIRQHPLLAALNRLWAVFSRIGGGGLDALLLLLVVLATLTVAGYSAWKRIRRRLNAWQSERRALEDSPASAVTAHYNRTLRLLARWGWRREEWMTPAEYLEHCRREWRDAPEAVEHLSTLTDCFQRAHYGGESDAASVAAARAAQEALARTCPRKRRASKSARTAETSA